MESVMAIPPQAEVEEVEMQPVEDGQDVENLLRYLTANDDHVLLPFNRSDLGRIKSVKISDAEMQTIQTFIEYLMEETNPETGQPYMQKGTFSEFFQLCTNIAFRYFAYLSEQRK